MSQNEWSRPRLPRWFRQFISAAVSLRSAAFCRHIRGRLWVGRTRSHGTQGRRIRFRSEPLEARELLAASVVLNEIHYDPDVKTEPVEFVELYNAGDEPADVSSWSLTDGISYTFPAGTVLPPGDFLVVSQDPAALRQKFAVESLGPFQGKLSNEGDAIVLLDGDGQRQDEVAYQLGFPWPTVGDAPGNSIELVQPGLDNDLAGSWRSSVSGPTPGSVNSRLADNVAPQMRQVEHGPQRPKSNETVTITVKVTDADGVSAVALEYQVVAPGDYISINDPRYETNWTSVAMHDDGSGGDAKAGDTVYTAVLPAALQQHRHLVRYRISATDGQGATVTGPYEDDPVPNFTYYVYDAVPDWTASVQPGVEPSVTFDSQLLESVQVYQLITTRQAHADAQQLPDAGIPPYDGRDLLWDGALVFDGQVYDHIRYRARGGVNRFARGKNSWKFDFNRGHELEARDNYGERYGTNWSKMNFSHIIQSARGFRGAHGLSEAISFRIFNLAGVEGPHTHFVHFRIVESDQENSADQYATDFQGLYLAVEQPDGRMLDEHDLPDGNLYKIEQGLDVPGTLNNQGPVQPSDSSDLIEFVNVTTDRRNRPTEPWWRENFDLDHYYSYRSIVEAVRHYDIASTNQYYFHNPDTRLWSVHPWDLDLTWRSTNVFGNGADVFFQSVLRRDEFELEYHNRLRETLDLLFNHDQTDMLIEEMAQFIYTPGQLSFTDAERAMWDYNPIVAAARAGEPGQFYESSPTRDFAGMLQVFRDFIDQRTSFLFQRVLRDEDAVPDTPVISYVGGPGFPVNELTFQTSSFHSPTNAPFAAIEWRLAEVTDPHSPEFDPSKPRTYEIEGTWESGELSTLQDTITVPSDKLMEGTTYRARVRMRDAEGIWSHWSQPDQFVAGPGTGPLVEGLRVTELNYHPHDPDQDSRFDSNDFEFIELRNVGSQTFDLVGVNFQDGVEFTFVGEASSVLGAAFDTNTDGFRFVHGAFGPTANASHEHGGYLEREGESGGYLQVQLGPGIDAQPVSLVNASFDGGADDFLFVPDAFNGTANSTAVMGNAEGGSVAITIGPGDTGGPASGAWTTSFDLAAANTVDVQLTYTMTIGPGFESTEFSEVVLEIDGHRYGNDINDSLGYLAGKAATTIGTVVDSFHVPLDAGRHTMALGVFNNQANSPDEFVQVSFDEVSVTLAEPGAIGPTSGAWSTTYNLPAAGTLEVALDYRMVLGEGFEPSEFGQLVLAVDGVRYGADVHDSLIHVSGGQENDTGWVATRVSVPLLDAGVHEITIGVENNGATASDEFVEVSLDNVQVTLFQRILLDPGQSVLVVADSEAFQSRYTEAHRIAGEYSSGRLSNGGERIIIKTPVNETIQDFTYDDRGNWPREADGNGSTLEAIDTAGDYNDPRN